MDIIVPMTANNLPVFRLNVEWMKRNLCKGRILVVGASGLSDSCASLGVGFLDEDQVYEGLALRKVKDYLKRRIGDSKRAGWYFQQFLKYAYAYACEEEYYIVWDADTVPLRPISHMEDGHPLFTKKEEMEPAYFATLGRLFGGSVGRYGDFSFICENMVFHAQTVKEMLGEILRQPGLQGKTFWERILSAVSDQDLPGSGFSEFETYGNYVMALHPGFYKLRSLKGLRKGAEYFGLRPSPAQLAWAAKSYDTIAFERWSCHHRLLGSVCRNPLVMALFPFSALVGAKQEFSRLRQRR